MVPPLTPGTLSASAIQNPQNALIKYFIIYLSPIKLYQKY